MRHILIIFSIFLLSSSVIGDNHKGETLYGWGNTLPYVWKGFGDKQTNPTYKGQVENGIPNGQGTLNLLNGEKYVGEWKNGRPHGQGTGTLPDGRKYVGEYKDGKRNGQGTLTFPDRSTFSDGRKYEGEWKDGKPWNGRLSDKKGNILYKIVNGI